MVFKTLFGFALRRRGLALGWPPSIKSLVNPRMQVRLRLSITGRKSSVHHHHKFHGGFSIWFKQRVAKSVCALSNRLARGWFLSDATRGK